MSEENRSEAFNNAFSNIHVSGAVEQGFFDKFDDPIAALGHMQRRLKGIAVDTVSNSGIEPDHLKGVEKVVVHEKDVFNQPKLMGAYHPLDSSLHFNVNQPRINEVIRHEVGHHVNEHRAPNDIPNLDTKGYFKKFGSDEAEADNFANSQSLSKNIYVHAAKKHLTGECTKPHGKFSHQMLKSIGGSYSDKMSSINPQLHEQITGEE